MPAVGELAGHLHRGETARCVGSHSIAQMADGVEQCSTRKGYSAQKQRMCPVLNHCSIRCMAAPAVPAQTTSSSTCRNAVCHPPLQHHRLQLRTRRIDGGCVTGRAGADDAHLSLQLQQGRRASAQAAGGWGAPPLAAAGGGGSSAAGRGVRRAMSGGNPLSATGCLAGQSSSCRASQPSLLPAGAPTCSTVMAAAADTKRASDCLRVADVRGKGGASKARCGGEGLGGGQLLLGRDHDWLAGDRGAKRPGGNA